MNQKLIESVAGNNRVKVCGEVLWDNGLPLAVCLQSGTHSHDAKVVSAISLGLARPITGDEMSQVPVSLPDTVPDGVGLSATTTSGLMRKLMERPHNPFSVLRLDDDGENMLRHDVSNMVGLVEASNGGFIGYVHTLHAERIAHLLNCIAIQCEEARQEAWVRQVLSNREKGESDSRPVANVRAIAKVDFPRG